jgi:hypothetical protein
LAKWWRFFVQTTASFEENLILILVSEKNANFLKPKIGKKRQFTKADFITAQKLHM